MTESKISGRKTISRAALSVALRTPGDLLPVISPSEDVLLTEKLLAKRWNLASPKKLQADRIAGVACPWVKIGRSVRYRLSDVLAYETANTRTSTSEN